VNDLLTKFKPRLDELEGLRLELLAKRKSGGVAMFVGVPLSLVISWLVSQLLGGGGWFVLVPFSVIITLAVLHWKFFGKGKATYCHHFKHHFLT